MMRERRAETGRGRIQQQRAAMESASIEQRKTEHGDEDKRNRVIDGR
jgi:hypothetical protein